MDRLHSMRVFSRVVDEGSFARAARELNLSPAVVTRLVADLEEHLGSRLINRTTRRLSLTDTGELYLERVRHILTEVEEAEALATAATAEPRGHLRVLCPPAFAVHQIAKHLPKFRALYPRVSIELSVPGPVETVDENFDVSILTEGRRPLDGNFIARRLARSEVVLCASPEYLDKRGRPQHPKDLESHESMVPPFLRELVLETGAGGDDEPPGESYTLVPKRSGLSTIHTDTMYAAALAGLGITGLPSFVAEDALLENALERVLPQWHLFTTTLYAGMPTRKHVPARTRVFVDFLVKTFGGEERDPWLIAAGCETQSRPKKGAPVQASLELTA
ncbi:LysR family transcriptional regulator [Rhizobacter sp. Root404]|uniref:LysR family transcriptional regulator n=1 Tax=Rhizobacter sp. Root404 TaxID=1736528 RepID=UPI0006F5AD56|nr:LysR family transcriptional regulator [Rhizobacter sp. Root404]KQW38937.1 LysR family transcriptional regulator [Rhizobacter sp. Root404]